MTFKIVDVKEETLDTKKIYASDEEKIEIVKPQTMNLPSYDYGASQNSIDGGYGVRNVPTFQYKILFGSYGLSTGNVSITGVGFKPTSVRLHSVFGGGTQSTGYANDGVFEKCIYIDSLGKSQLTNAEIVRIYDNVGAVSQIGSISSYDEDGITINFASAASTANYVLECFR